MILRLLILLFALSFTTVFAASSTIDNAALSWLATLDKNEIAVAKETLKRSNNPNVNSYAKQLLQDHTNNLQKTLSFNPALTHHPVKTKGVVTLKKEGTSALHQLQRTARKNYNALFVKDMVEGHRNALLSIDEILPELNGDIKKHFEATRMVVNHHLKEAQALQQMLSNKKE